tara:strand:- start:777 stop:1076 length:300 start_codon:yes stop_codon:yes gene_type:complete
MNIDIANTEFNEAVNTELNNEPNTEPNYDMVNPSHYKNTSIETIDKMLRIWGAEALAAHCEMCAFKYRERIGSKPGQSVEQELKKINWYESYAKELRSY